MSGLVHSVALLFATVCTTVLSGTVMAQPPPTPPATLTLRDALRIAGEQRNEIRAAQFRIRGAAARPRIVSALADPMIAPAIDHKPFMMSGADISLTLEQQVPLSGIRGHRRASAVADLARITADADRTTLDVEPASRLCVPDAAGTASHGNPADRADRIRT